MHDKVFIIKMINDGNKKDIITLAEESIKNGTEIYYNPTSNDQEIIKPYINDDGILVIIIYHNNVVNNCPEIEKLMIGNGSITQEKKIRYRMLVESKSNTVIENFISNTELDINNDFKYGSYVMVEFSKVLIRQLEFLTYTPYKPIAKNNQKYEKLKSDENLDLLAQHNTDCRRIFGTREIHKDRNEFQRDRERIINSKAFRRLVDKAQIFTSSKGDHYRTRMTHTLEVAQIARAIAISLGLNVDLTEAIAYAHDLGHTPFGHQGERTLDAILKNEIKVISMPKGMELKNIFGGFKHNFQGLRVLTHIEEKYADFSGLDVSFQVLEGVLKHTRVKAKDCVLCNKEKCKQECFDLSEFIEKEYIDLMYPDQECASTLEGQVVAVADEIAQRSHDIDDAFSSSLLSKEDFLDYLKLNTMKELRTTILQTVNKISESKRFFIDESELLCARIVSEIVNYFVTDVVSESSRSIASYKKACSNNSTKINKKIINFSGTGKRINDYLEKMISKIAINSLEVTKFDNNAETIVLTLFKEYYNNPKLLHKGTLQRIYLDIKDLHHNNPSFNLIDFNYGDFRLIKKELKKIATYKIPQNDIDCSNWTPDDHEYWQKRKILVRNIADYISGMTDSYAINEYNSILNKNL